MIAIDRKDSAPLYQQIHRQVVQCIETGVYRADDRLPSIRPFAQELGVSRNTVEQAYLQLTQEGYVRARQGSGYFVNPIQAIEHEQHELSSDVGRALDNLRAFGECDDTVQDYDFSCERPDPSTFPYYQWARISRDVMLDSGHEAAFRIGDPRGLKALRTQVARYLIKELDISADPAQIAVFPSTEYALASLLSTFDRPGCTLLAQDPIRPGIAGIFSRSGFAFAPIGGSPRIDWKAMDAAYSHHDRSLIYTAPASCFPVNQVMPLSERKRLIEWASQRQVFLIEDEYCHEFRFGTPHLPSLHALDRGRCVVTIGSFAESLSPTMGIAYFVLPARLMQRWVMLREGTSSQVPWQTQATMAEFMQQDLFFGHLRKLRTTYRRKLDKLLAAIDCHMADRVDFAPREGGLHILVRTRDNRTENELVDLAAKGGVRVYATSRHWTGEKPAGWNYVLLGYSGIPEELIEPGIAALSRAWFSR